MEKVRFFCVYTSLLVISAEAANARSDNTVQYQNDLLTQKVTNTFQGKSSNLEIQQLSQRFYGEADTHSIAKLDYVKSFNGRKLYLNLSSSDNESSSLIGLSYKNVTVSFLNGRSEAFLRNAGSYTSAFRFGLHGGNSTGFKFQGAAINTKVYGKLNAQLGFAELKSNNQQLEDRSTKYVKLLNNHLYGQMGLLNRGKQKIGYALEAGYKLGKNDILIQHISANENKLLTRLGLKHALNHSTNITFNLINAKDSQHFDESRNIVLFSMMHKFNVSAPYIYHMDNKDSVFTKKSKERRFGSNALLIGLGAVAGTALSSSGSIESDNRSRHNSERDAAFTVLNEVNPKSIRENREYGGWIVRNDDNSYGASAPVVGDESSVVLPKISSRGLTASYHTHGAFDPRYDSENYSPTDIANDNSLGIGGYLGTPSGAMKYHFGGDVSTVGTIATQ